MSFSHQVTAHAEHIDELGHVNNAVWVQWIQELAVAHWNAVADPAQTPLVRAARAARGRVVTGAEILALQASVQFVLYTGVRPTPGQVAQATAFARAE